MFWWGGRTARRAYWVLLIGQLVIGGISHPAFVAFARAAPKLLPLAGLAMLALDAAVLWLVICLSTRRLHDLGRTGWWQAPAFAVLVGAYALAEPAWSRALGLAEQAAKVAFLAGGLAYLVFLVVLGALPGEPAANRFGPPTAISA